jgi:gentisate 1,2-dioxygenase
MTSPPPAYQIETHNDSQEQLLTDLPSVAALPLWKQMSVLVPAHPKPKAVPHKWSSVHLEVLSLAG